MRMSKKAQNKLRGNGGFTLAETLLAILILLMVSAIVATGIPVAKNAYDKVVVAANAEVLLSTAITSLRNELGTAQDVHAEGDRITYYNPGRGSSSRIFIPQEDGAVKRILFQRYYFDPEDFDMDDDVVPNAELFVPASTEDLYVTFTSVSYSGGIVTFSGLSVDRESGTKGLAARDQLSIRVLSYSG